MRTLVSNRHMKTVHIDQSIKKFLCDQCPFSSHAKRYLEEHNAKEHGKNAIKTVFLCERCKKTFAERGYLQHHVCNQGNLLRGTVKLVSQELIYFGVIAHLFWQIGGHSMQQICALLLFLETFYYKMIKSVKVFPISF